MDAFAELDSEKQVELLLAHAHSVLASYDLGEIGAVESINHEFNSTFSVESAEGLKYALRINVNSDRNLANANGEIEFINHLASTTNLSFATPIAKLNGEFVSYEMFEPLERSVVAVLFSWLEGEELGDEPTETQLAQVGAAMARMHEVAEGLTFSRGAELPELRDVLWLTENLLTGQNSKLDAAAERSVGMALDRIDKVVETLYEHDTVRPIHADIHGWNCMWNEESISIFDFDDSGIGLPIQDVFTSVYYLDTPEQEAALFEGYRSVRELPEHTGYQREALLMQRRLILLNYLFETSTPEHRDMLPKYLEESLIRVEKFLSLKP
jgi:hypothetical protein